VADLELTALDGGRVSATGPDVPSTTAGCTAVAVLTVGNRLHEFTAGDARFWRAQALSMNVAENATYRMHGGLVRIGTGEERAPEGVVLSYMQVAWEGRNHSLATIMYQGNTAAGLALLDAIEIQEGDSGIILHPRDARISILQNSQHAPVVMIPIRGEGMLDAFRASRYWETKRPRWAGTPARGGQLYAEKYEDKPAQEGNASMLLFGSRAVTRIYVNDKDNGLANRATNLAVDWA